MTTKQTLRELKAAGKSVKVQQLYRYFAALNIKPQGAAQRPQQYPEDTALRIKQHLGLVPLPAHTHPPLESVEVRAALPTLRELKTVSRNARRGK